MDALHVGLEQHPTTGRHHGCTISMHTRSAYVATLGYADDTAILASSLPSLHAQNAWVHYFMQYNRLRLNPRKCELVGFNANGCALTEILASAHDIHIEGHPLIPRRHDQPIRYLGLHFRCDGSWETQQQKARSMIMLFTNAATKFSLPLQQAVYMFNTFLMPKLELALRYIHGVGTSNWVKSCDRMIIGCIKHLVSAPIQFSHTAVALSLGLMLPSWLEATIKVSELFLRINSNDPRWGQLGRMMLHMSYPSLLHHSNVPNRTRSDTRILRTAYHVVHTLGWIAHMQSSRNVSLPLRHRWLLHSTPLNDMRDAWSVGGTAYAISLPDGTELRVMHDIWSGGASVLMRRNRLP